MVAFELTLMRRWFREESMCYRNLSVIAEIPYHSEKNCLYEMN